jgi:hypothetical protein
MTHEIDPFHVRRIQRWGRRRISFNLEASQLKLAQRLLSGRPHQVVALLRRPEVVGPSLAVRTPIEAIRGREGIGAWEPLELA